MSVFFKYLSLYVTTIRTSKNAPMFYTNRYSNREFSFSNTIFQKTLDKTKNQNFKGKKRIKTIAKRRFLDLKKLNFVRQLKCSYKLKIKQNMKLQPIV